MKDFMFLFRSAGNSMDFSPEEIQSSMQKWLTWIDELKAKNLYKSGEPLTPEGKVVRGGEALITDGPFTESKEVVGGFFIISANSLERLPNLQKVVLICLSTVVLK